MDFARYLDESWPFANYSHNLITNPFPEVMRLMEQIMWKRFDKPPEQLSGA